MENKLIENMRKFDERRAEMLLGIADRSSNECSKRIAEAFLPIAKYAIYGGHFHVICESDMCSFGYDIRLNKIELYYHEEKNGGHKDPIMYHTNLHVPYYFKERGLNVFPYYDFGSLNLHLSGIDITFEKENEYRASFLIRDFTAYDSANGKVISKVKSDPYSTHIFEYFFPNGVSQETLKQVIWVEDNSYEQVIGLQLKQNVRKNVPKYDQSNSKMQETQCDKPWQFCRVLDIL